MALPSLVASAASEPSFCTVTPISDKRVKALAPPAIGFDSTALTWPCMPRTAASPFRMAAVLVLAL